MEMDWNEFVRRAVDQTILAIVERSRLSHGILSEQQWFRVGEGMGIRPRSAMHEYYQEWAPIVGLIVPTYLNHLFRENRVKESRFVLYRGDSFDPNLCYAIHHQLAFVVTEHNVIRVVQAFITALCESPDFSSWRHKQNIVIHCPNGASFSLYDHNTYPGFLRM